MVNTFKAETTPTHYKDLDKVDMRFSFLPLGVRLETKAADEAWLALDQEDWKILHGLLTKPLAAAAGTLSAAQASNALSLLAEWAAACVRWYERTGTVARPEGSGVGE